MADIKGLLEFSKPLNVLYVEDDISIRNNYEKIFKEIFGNVDVAKDGQEGLDKYHSSDYDIVITDINMPRLNGIKMIQAILEISAEQSIIVTSAHDDSAYLLELIELGIEKFLIKPIDFSKMLLVLIRTCKRLHEIKELKDYQNCIEDENLNNSALLKQLKRKNDELEKTIHKLTREENIAITLVEGIEKEKEFSSEALEFLSPKIDTLSAQDFIEGFAGDLDNLNHHLETIEENLELLIHQKLINPTPQSVKELSKYFCDYGMYLSHLYKFAHLSEALQNFGESIATVEDLSLLKEMKEFLFGIADSLQKWRQEVLITQTAKDIHFLDNSIISDCLQTESMLSSTPHADDSLEDLFF